MLGEIMKVIVFGLTAILAILGVLLCLVLLAILREGSFLQRLLISREKERNRREIQHPQNGNHPTHA
jgi:hypothetical protein